MTYDELVAKIKSFANTDDPDSDGFNQAIPGFIKDAEERISKEIDLTAEIANAVTTATIQAGQRLVTKPPAAKAILLFRLAETSTSPFFPLQMRTRSWCEDFLPDRGTTGLPRYYCIFDDETLMVVPTLNRPYVAELTHQIYITGLSQSVQTTWLSINAAELLFEACMRKVGEYQKQPDRVSMHDSQYTTIIPLEQIEAVKRMRDSLRIS